MCMCCQTPPAHKSNLKYLKLAYKFLFKNLCGSIYHRTTYFFDLGYLVSFWFFAYQLKLYLEMLHWIKLREYGLSRTRILLYKFRIYKSAFMQENTGQWKIVLLHILCSVSWKVCLIFRMVLLIKVLISWSVRVWSFSGPYFPAFGLNTERYSVFVRIRENTHQINSEYGQFSRSDWLQKTSYVHIPMSYYVRVRNVTWINSNIIR